VDHLGRGKGQQSTGRPEKKNLATIFFWSFGSPFWSPTPPPPVDRNIFWSGSQYILRFGRFYAQYGPGVRDGGGVSAKRTT